MQGETALGETKRFRDWACWTIGQHSVPLSTTNRDLCKLKKILYFLLISLFLYFKLLTIKEK